MGGVTVIWLKYFEPRSEEEWHTVKNVDLDTRNVKYDFIWSIFPMLILRSRNHLCVTQRMRETKKFFFFFLDQWTLKELNT